MQENIYEDIWNNVPFPSAWEFTHDDSFHYNYGKEVRKTDNQIVNILSDIQRNIKELDSNMKEFDVKLKEFGNDLKEV